MKNIVTFLLFLILFSNYSFSYDWLYVQDPRGWMGGQGTIEEASLSIKPSGIFMEYELYLTFSAKGLGYSNSDTLEVQFFFDLPENSIVCDSWLWMEDTIVTAIIMDKWTASSIYENIVKRRRDPSILFKKEGGDHKYELRIFPMAGNSSRKVKITYLVPPQWGSSSVISPLPINLLRTSLYQVPEFDLSVWLNQDWKNPEILELPGINFQSEYDPISGDYFKADIPPETFQNNLNFKIDSPLKNGVYISKFENESEGIYQMAFLPSQALDISASSKVAILIDYEAFNTTITKTELINNLKSSLLLNFSSTDSFNIIISKANIQRISETWLPADTTTIDSIFNALGENQIANYSSLPGLLADGIDFIKTNGNDGSILLVSSSDDVGDYEGANQLIGDLVELMDPKLPIHVVNFQNQNFYYHWFGERYYLGNEYFYLNITRITSANYFDVSNHSFSQIFPEAIQSLDGYISSFDLHTKLNDGFCYGRYNLDPNVNAVYFNKPILQVGKFSGNFPFIIEVSGIYKSDPFSQTFSLDSTEIYEADSLSEEMWAGNYIEFLESQDPSNEVVSEIVNYSISERVLSIYSAFICLEPNVEWEICYDCLDEGGGIPNEAIEDSIDIDDGDLTLSAYPNPFNSQITLNVKLPGSANPENLSFRIYDILGQVVKTFDPDLVAGQREHRFTWDGTNDEGYSIASGIYFFIVTTPEKNYSVKLLLMK
jgi:Ca-activated chloride channel family protein